jgi:hypothetical protein
MQPFLVHYVASLEGEGDSGWSLEPQVPELSREFPRIDLTTDGQASHHQTYVRVSHKPTMEECVGIVAKAINKPALQIRVYPRGEMPKRILP